MMDAKPLFQQLYTVAFRLTGEKETASNLVLAALSSENDFCRGRKSIRPTQFFMEGSREICYQFLSKSTLRTRHSIDCVPDIQENNYACAQAALLYLKPLQRVVVVWRDIAKLPLIELTPLVKKPSEELYFILGQARRQIKQQLI